MKHIFALLTALIVVLTVVTAAFATAGFKGGYVCHKGDQTLYFGPHQYKAYKAHLNHGDRKGKCKVHSGGEPGKAGQCHAGKPGKAGQPGKGGKAGKGDEPGEPGKASKAVKAGKAGKPGQCHAGKAGKPGKAAQR